MGHALTLEIPDHVYEPLVKRAEQVGKTPEEIVMEWVAHASQLLTDDPLLQLVGAFASNLADVNARHDDYLGQSLFEELRGRSFCSW
jgi:hypothetical protein